jgi:hypothetical protein
MFDFKLSDRETMYILSKTRDTLSINTGNGMKYFTISDVKPDRHCLQNQKEPGASLERDVDELYKSITKSSIYDDPTEISEKKLRRKIKKHLKHRRKKNPQRETDFIEFEDSEDDLDFNTKQKGTDASGYEGPLRNDVIYKPDSMDHGIQIGHIYPVLSIRYVYEELNKKSKIFPTETPPGSSPPMADLESGLEERLIQINNNIHNIETETNCHNFQTLETKVDNIKSHIHKNYKDVESENKRIKQHIEHQTQLIIRLKELKYRITQGTIPKYRAHTKKIADIDNKIKEINAIIVKQNSLFLVNKDRINMLFQSYNYYLDELLKIEL